MAKITRGSGNVFADMGLKDADKLLQQAKDKHGHMSPADFTAIQNALGLSDTELSRALRLQPTRTVRRWKAGMHPIPGPVSLLMNMFEVNPGLVNFEFMHGKQWTAEQQEQFENRGNK